MRRLSIYILCCLCTLSAWPQAKNSVSAATLIAPPAINTCRVLDPELQNHYTGPCSGDGWAHGMGKATGAYAHYEGRFVFGAKQGVGTKSWTNTGDRYEGDFFQDARDGSGIYTWGDSSSAKGSRYVGQFQNDLRHGKGSFYWGNGDVAHGQWALGKQLTPATSMQSLQILHTQALVKALAIGQVVCQGGFASEPQKQLRGIVVSRDGNSLGVRLVPIPHALGVGEHPFVTSFVTDWWPC